MSVVVYVVTAPTPLHRSQYWRQKLHILPVGSTRLDIRGGKNWVRSGPRNATLSGASMPTPSRAAH